MVDLNSIEGHIVLLCKGHYSYEDGEFFEALKKIWAVRCGYDYNPNENHVLTYIADAMYKIIVKCQPSRVPYLQEQLHKELTNNSFWKPQGMTAIEAIIWEYRSILCNMQVKEKVNNKFVPIVRIPKPKKRLINRILRGNGKYSDYELITK